MRSILNDALYRGSFTLLVNTITTAAIGLVFWTLAARNYPASTVGVFSGVTSGVGLLATIAALGLPMTMIRHVVSAGNQRELVVAAIAVIVTVGSALSLITVLALGPHLPAALHLQQRGKMVLLVTALVSFTAVSSTIDAGLVAIRSSHIVLFKNLVGSIIKVISLILLIRFQSGLLISYGLGLGLATVFSSVALSRQLAGKRVRIRSFIVLRNYLSFTSGTYLATILGMLPLTVVPLEVLAIRGAAQTAQFAVAFLIAGFLNFIPATVAQVLFAEASRQGVPLGRQLRKALRGVYSLLLPALVVVIASAPLLLRLFGATYSAATGCLRVLALSTLLTGGTYLVDSLLIARDRTAAYVFINWANAALVLGGVGILLPRGLTAAAGGWALGQGLSLIIGLIILATGRAGRHRSRFSPTAAGKVPQDPERGLQQPPPDIQAFESQIRKLLAIWPMMPTTLIAERIGWDQSIETLLNMVTELRLGYLYSHEDRDQASYPAGETAQCGLWFPPIEIPVGSGQTRSAQQLPVLTMITGYSRWLTAILIPSRQPGDLFAGLWELLTTLGAVPKVLTWDDDAAIGGRQLGQMKLTKEAATFFHALGVRLVIGRSADSQTRGLVERAQAYLEHSFLPGRTFASPIDFNVQLKDWLYWDNTQPRKPPYPSPAELMNADRRAMLRLPPVPPPSGWRLSINVGSYPLFRFDSNTYFLHRDVIGNRVEVIANLSKIRVLCEGRLAAVHDRSWAREQMIRDPVHGLQADKN